MAIARVQELGGSGSSASGVEQSIILTVDTTVGNHIIVYAGGGGAAPTQCEDSKGNVYTRDTPTPQAADPRTVIFSAKVDTQLVSGDGITITYGGSTSTRVVSAVEYSGLDGTSWFDVGEEGGTGGVAANAVDSGATATTAQADELVCGVVMHASTVSSYAPETLSPAWNQLTTRASTGTVRTLRPHDRIVSATDAMAMKASWTGTARTTGAAVAAYKGASSGPQTITLGLLDGSATLYAPAVSPQPVGVTTPLLDGSATQYAPTLARYNTLTLGLLDGFATLYAPTLASASQTVTLGLLDGAAALYTPSLLPKSSLTLGLLDGVATLFAPTLAAKSALSLGLIDGVATLNAPTLAVGPVTATLPLLDGAAALYAPTIVRLAGPAIWTTPINTASITSTPTLAFTIPAGGGFKHFQIQLDDDSGYGSPNIWDSSQDQTGWEYWNGSTWAAVPVGGVDSAYEGNEARYTVQSALAPGTYYRRVRAGVLS